MTLDPKWDYELEPVCKATGRGQLGHGGIPDSRFKGGVRDGVGIGLGLGLAIELRLGLALELGRIQFYVLHPETARNKA